MLDVKWWLWTLVSWVISGLTSVGATQTYDENERRGTFCTFLAILLNQPGQCAVRPKENNKETMILISGITSDYIWCEQWLSCELRGVSRKGVRWGRWPWPRSAAALRPHTTSAAAVAQHCCWGHTLLLLLLLWGHTHFKDQMPPYLPYLQLATRFTTFLIFSPRLVLTFWKGHILGPDWMWNDCLSFVNVFEAVSWRDCGQI